MRLGILAAVVGLVVVACGQAGTDGPTVGRGADGTEGVRDVPRCEDVTEVAAPDDWYRDEPLYVGNEMPVEQVRAWASDKPGFEEVWIDRDHNGWVAVAFSQDAEERQAELSEEFGEAVGAVVVPVDWTMEELRDLQQRVVDAFADEGVGSGVSVTKGIVSIDFGVLTDDRIAAVEEQFGGERVCVSGRDPAEVPTAGPQRTEGDGWRLLADAQGAGQAYRTGIATDADAYDALWDTVGLDDPRPDVDFEREVVIWFGAVFGSSCPDLRLDDVVVDDDRALVHAEVVLVDPPAACTDDANPHAYLVAVERERLPAGPFMIQLRADDPPRGAPEERTYVDVDLTAPGAVAGPDDIRSGDASDLPPDAVTSGDVVEPGYPATYRLDTRCGVEWLGVLNDVAWRAEDPDVADVPPAWRDAVDDDGMLLVEVTIASGPPPTATAAAHGHEIVYVPAEGDPPACP